MRKGIAQLLMKRLTLIKDANKEDMSCICATAKVQHVSNQSYFPNLNQPSSFSGVRDLF